MSIINRNILSIVFRNIRHKRDFEFVQRLARELRPHIGECGEGGGVKGDAVASSIGRSRIAVTGCLGIPVRCAGIVMSGGPVGSYRAGCIESPERKLSLAVTRVGFGGQCVFQLIECAGLIAAQADGAGRDTIVIDPAAV